MAIFKWDKNFETGIDEVDRQHQHLVNVINQFGELVTQNRADSAEVEAIFAELSHYTQYHFDEEERFMELIGVDQGYLSDHKEEHLSFLQEVTLMHQEMAKGKEISGKHLFEYLVNWLICHILGSDMSMSRQIKAIKGNVSALDAYQLEKHGVDQSKGLLLTALHNLFLQVSNRNKQLSELNQTLEDKVEERTQALSEANQRLGTLASTDVLTGISNRRHGMQMLEKLWVDSEQNRSSLACMMVDADGFKAINDTYGHDAGDAVLCKLAKALTFAVRTDDIVCRMGGDEFLIILPNTDIEGALKIAQQTQLQIAELKVPVTGGAWKGSISVGVAEKTATMENVKDLIREADQGVYAAKKAGKNCVRIVVG